MNRARFVTASVAAFVAIAVVNVVVHGIVLGGIYQQAASAFRKEVDGQRLFWLFYVGYLVFALLFTFIYGPGRVRLVGLEDLMSERGGQACTAA